MSKSNGYLWLSKAVVLKLVGSRVIKHQIHKSSLLLLAAHKIKWCSCLITSYLNLIKSSLGLSTLVSFMKVLGRSGLNLVIIITPPAPYFKWRLLGLQTVLLSVGQLLPMSVNLRMRSLATFESDLSFIWSFNDQSLLILYFKIFW